MRKCSVCGQSGHTKRSCPGKHGEPIVTMSVIEAGLQWFRNRRKKIDETIELLEEVQEQERIADKAAGE